jgi:hypothetical protein
MPRRKRNKLPLAAARLYVSQHLPELSGRALRLRTLDGPPESPRYAATLEACVATVCPRGFTAQAGAGDQCGVLDCPLRRSVRLLLDRRGVVRQTTLSGIHWN